jgi:hypothetical protein
VLKALPISGRQAGSCLPERRPPFDTTPDSHTMVLLYPVYPLRFESRRSTKGIEQAFS